MASTLEDVPGQPSLIRVAIVLGLVALITFLLWRVRDVLTLANFSLIYLLLTLLIAVWQGTAPSLIAAFVSFFCFNYFLIKPYYTLTVKDPRELLDLFIFLLVALITGQLAAYARKQTQDARHRAREQNTLYELSSAFNRLNDREKIFQTLRGVIQDQLPITTCDVLDSSNAAASDDNQPTLYLLIGMNEQVYGTLRVAFLRPPTEAQRRFLMACVVQAAMALQRIDMAEDVQRSQAIAEADRLKTTLLQAVSHDLRTPITIIKTAANTLYTLGDQMPPAAKADMTQVIEQEADTLDHLVGNLLDMSRLQAGALTLLEDWTSLSEIAGDVAALAWQRHHTARIRLELADDMPLVWCDHGLMLQALGNITDNMIRYEPPERLVEMRGRYDEQNIYLTIANHGPTLPPEEKQRMMKPFYHGHDGHIGLGLAISKGIVEAHRGRIRIEDTPGGGVTFIIALPRSPLEEPTHVDSHRR